MEIRRWQIYVVINCVIVTHLVAKPVSLNELIAAESKQKQKSQHTKPTATRTAKTVSLNELTAAESKQIEKKSESSQPTRVASTTPKTFSTKESSPSESRQNLEKTRFPKILAKQPRRKPFSLKDIFAADKTTQAKRRIERLLSKSSGGALFPNRHRRKLLPSLTKHFESAEDIFSLARSISPLKFRKKFEISSPLKPRKIKYSFTPRHKRRNQSTNSETNENEVFNHRYIPLFKRIGLLVDDILSPDTGESIEHNIKRKKPRRKPKLPNKRKDADLASSESKPQKATIVAPSTVSPETTDTEDPTSETPDTTAYTTPVGHIYTLRPDTDLPLPFTGNPSSDRRNHHGVSEGSGPAFHGDVERHIARHNGSDEHNSSGGRNQTYPSFNEENSCSSTRIDKCSDGSGDGNHTRYRNNAIQIEETKNSSGGFIGRNDTERKNTFQIGGEQEALQIPRNIRLSGRIPDNKVLIVNAESVPPQKSREESFFGITNHHTSAERGSEWNGTAATENQRFRQVIQGITPIDDLLNPDFLRQRTQNNQVVTIFDGYSVARDINGRNKLTEKSIRISPN